MKGILLVCCGVKCRIVLLVLLLILPICMSWRQMWIRTQGKSKNCIGLRRLRPLYSSYKQQISSFKSAPPAPINKTLVTNMMASRIEISGDRFAVVGDYVTTRKYGAARYIGLRYVPVYPSRSTAESMQKKVAVAVLLYDDGELLVYDRFFKTHIYFVAPGGKEVAKNKKKPRIDKLGDSTRWEKKQEKVQEKSLGIASNLIKTLSLRNALYRQPCAADDHTYEAFSNAFPYAPTIDQIRTFREVASDMINNTRPMDRLVCGDVGYGKTEVAIRAAFRAVQNRRQVAVLCPTRILAIQHEKAFRARLPPEVNVQLLLGSSKGRNKIMSAVSSHRTDVLVGTHALLGSKLNFSSLGLLIIDEEQKFGVKQKEHLREKYHQVDLLTLSATPIPRTLQMGLKGIRDMSKIATAPSMRKGVEVHIYSLRQFFFIPYLIMQEVQRGGQVFMVTPFVGDLEAIQTLLDTLLPSNVSIITVFGKQKELEENVLKFRNKEGHVLLATPLIENGVDIPNANTMIVLDAERFGMATLYQLKGRVGRGAQNASAHFFTRGTQPYDDMRDNIAKIAEVQYVLPDEVRQNLSTHRLFKALNPAYHYHLNETAVERLSNMQVFSNTLGGGYDLAKRDLEQRGSGTLFGESQSGESDVGDELAQQMLMRSLAFMKQKLVLPLPDVHIKWGDAIESIMRGVRVGKAAGLSSSPTSLAELAAYEEKLIDGVVSLLPADAQHVKSGGLASYIKGVHASKDVLSVEALLPPSASLSPQTVYMVQLLLLRMRMRFACRGLSIVCAEVIPSLPATPMTGSPIKLFFYSRHLSRKKLAILLQDAAISLELKLKEWEWGTGGTIATDSEALKDDGEAELDMDNPNKREPGDFLPSDEGGGVGLKFTLSMHPAGVAGVSWPSALVQLTTIVEALEKLSELAKKQVENCGELISQ